MYFEVEDRRNQSERKNICNFHSVGSVNIPRISDFSQEEVRTITHINHLSFK